MEFNDDLIINLPRIVAKIQLPLPPPGPRNGHRCTGSTLK